jgi:hypothetical protein
MMAIGSKKILFYVFALISCIILLLYAISNREIYFTEEYGKFSGSPIVEFLPNPNVRLIKEFEYTDPKGQLWRVPAPFDTDCASIPPIAQLGIGGRCDDVYRDAAIIHDYYCRNFQTPWADGYKRDWKEVHRAFYYGMRARGVDETKAKLMFAAVYHLGPRWEWDGDRVREVGVERFLGQDVNPEDDLFNFIQTENPSLKEIESYKSGNELPARYSPKRWTPALKLNG